MGRVFGTEAATNHRNMSLFGKFDQTRVHAAGQAALGWLCQGSGVSLLVSSTGSSVLAMAWRRWDDGGKGEEEEEEGGCGGGDGKEEEGERTKKRKMISQLICR